MSTETSIKSTAAVTFGPRLIVEPDADGVARCLHVVSFADENATSISISTAAARELAGEIESVCAAFAAHEGFEFDTDDVLDPATVSTSLTIRGRPTGKRPEVSISIKRSGMCSVDPDDGEDLARMLRQVADRTESVRARRVARRHRPHRR